MMSVIERVAQAIDKAPEFRTRRNKLNAYHSQYEVFLADPILTGGDAVSRFASWGEAYADARKRTSQSRARAALTELMEPAPEITKPFASAQYGVYGDVQAEVVWKKMITTILKETP